MFFVFGVFYVLEFFVISVFDVSVVFFFMCLLLRHVVMDKATFCP